MCVSTDARPQAPAHPVPGRQLRVPVHGELLRAARAPVAPSATAVLPPVAGPAHHVLAGRRRVPAARLARPPPPASASRGRRGRGWHQGVRVVRVRAAGQVLQDGRQGGVARRGGRATAAATAVAVTVTASPTAAAATASAPTAPAAPAAATATTGAAVVPVPAQAESVFAGQHVRVAAVVRRQHAPAAQGRVLGQGHAEFRGRVGRRQDDQK